MNRVFCGNEIDVDNMADAAAKTTADSFATFVWSDPTVSSAVSKQFLQDAIKNALNKARAVAFGIAQGLKMVYQ